MKSKSVFFFLRLPECSGAGGVSDAEELSIGGHVLKFGWSFRYKLSCFEAEEVDFSTQDAWESSISSPEAVKSRFEIRFSEIWGNNLADEIED